MATLSLSLNLSPPLTLSLTQTLMDQCMATLSLSLNLSPPLTLSLTLTLMDQCAATAVPSSSRRVRVRVLGIG